jgi:cadmium resistance protein CadD (predicted permease)
VTHVVQVVSAAAGAFVGTNIDDFVVLLLLTLGMPFDGIRRWQIVSGQYLGFCALLVLSGIGALALHTIADSWVGLLGIIPLALGVRGIIRVSRESSQPEKAPILANSIAAVAVITLANGGDNISVYVLLFRQLNPIDLLVTILTFLFLLGVLCGTALIIAKNVQFISKVMRGNQWLTPLVFITIGLLVLIRTDAAVHIFNLVFNRLGQVVGSPRYPNAVKLGKRSAPEGLRCRSGLAVRTCRTVILETLHYLEKKHA